MVFVESYRRADLTWFFKTDDLSGPDVVVFPDEERRGLNGHVIPTGPLDLATPYIGRVRDSLCRIGDQNKWKNTPDHPVTWYRKPTWSPMVSRYLTLANQAGQSEFGHDIPYFLYGEIVDPIKKFLPRIYAQLPNGPVPGDVRVTCSSYIDTVTDGKIIMMVSRQDASMGKEKVEAFETARNMTSWSLSPSTRLRLEFKISKAILIPLLEIFYGKSSIDSEGHSPELPQLIYAVTVHPFFRDPDLLDALKPFQ